MLGSLERETAGGACGVVGKSEGGLVDGWASALGRTTLIGVCVSAPEQSPVLPDLGSAVLRRALFGGSGFSGFTSRTRVGIKSAGKIDTGGTGGTGPPVV